MTQSIKSKEFAAKAYELFDEFYNAQALFRARCRENEGLWRGTHWDDVKVDDMDEPRPVTPVLFSTLEGVLADLMDSYPEAALLAEDIDYDEDARDLGDAVNCLLKRLRYRKTYRSKCSHALKYGFSVQQIIWDKDAFYGIGDIKISIIDPRNFLYDPNESDIQNGRACFTFGFETHENLTAKYGNIAAECSGGKYKRALDETGDKKNNGDKNSILVINYWHKSYDRKKALTCVHMAKIAGGVLLYDSRKTFKNGIFNNAKYPFIAEALYPIEGSASGLGLCDIFGDLQRYADKMDQLILKNALMSGRVKMLINRSAGVDSNQMADWSQEVVEANRIDDNAIRWFQPQALNPYVLTHHQSKMGAIKEESGQNQFIRGEAGKGVTAASAIMALQEAGSKRSRLIVNQMYDGFEELVSFVLHLMAQFYTESRSFRLQNGEVISINSNKLNLGENKRMMDFDISVFAQKSNPFSTIYQNDMAMKLMMSGAITPETAISMMSFEGREKVLAQITAKAGTIKE